MHKSKQTFNKEVRKLAEEVAQLVVLKQKDYSKDNIVKCPVDPKLGVVIRLNDKLMRLGNLLQLKGTPNNETVRDTWVDIIGYGLIGLMLEDETFLLPLE